MKVQSHHMHIHFNSTCPTCSFSRQKENESVTIFDIVEVGLPICQECGEELNPCEFSEVEQKQYQK